MELALDTMKLGAQDYLIKGEFDERILEKAISYFSESLRLEPDRSKTHSAIASAYAFMPYFSQARSLGEAGELIETVRGFGYRFKGAESA